VVVLPRHLRLSYLHGVQRGQAGTNLSWHGDAVQHGLRFESDQDRDAFIDGWYVGYRYRKVFRFAVADPGFADSLCRCFP
jgi:hypothetical protein